MRVLCQHQKALTERSRIGQQGVVMHRERAKCGHHIHHPGQQSFGVARAYQALGQAHNAGVDGGIHGAAELQRPGAVPQGQQAGDHNSSTRRAG
jgi:hypothetical protein